MPGTELTQTTKDALLRVGVNSERAQVLKDNTFGILVDEQLTDEEKIARLIGLIPVALEIEAEARETIERLNNRVEELENDVRNGT